MGKVGDPNAVVDSKLRYLSFLLIAEYKLASFD